MHTHTRRFSTHAHGSHTQASRLTIRFPCRLPTGTRKIPKEADQQKKILPKQTQQNKINPTQHPKYP